MFEGTWWIHAGTSSLVHCKWQFNTFIHHTSPPSITLHLHPSHPIDVEAARMQFERFDEDNSNEMLRVIRNHRLAAMGTERDSDEWEDLEIRPVPIDHDTARSGNINIASH